MDKWLADVQSVPTNDTCDGDYLPPPVPNARVIVAPHAGFSYSGSTAAWAYAALDLCTTMYVYSNQVNVL